MRALVPLILLATIYSSMAFLVYSNSLRDFRTDLVSLLLKDHYDSVADDGNSERLCFNKHEGGSEHTLVCIDLSH